MATITKVGEEGKKGVYQVRWRERREDGNWRQRKAKVTGHAEAEKKRGEMHAKYEGKLAVAVSDANLSDNGVWWLDRYAQIPRKKGGKRVEPPSWEEAARTIKRLTEAFGDRTPDRITTEELETWVNGHDVADATKARMVGTLKAFWTDMVALDHTTTNVAKGLPSWQVGANAQPPAHVPPLSHIEAIADELDSMHYVAPHPNSKTATITRRRYPNALPGYRPSDRLWLFAYSGFRFSEARGLNTTADRGNVLKLSQTWPRGASGPRPYGKNAHSLREVPMIERLRPVVDRLKCFTRDGMLLTGPEGTLLPYSHWQTALDGASKRAGHHITTHELRHFATSLWVKAGANPTMIQRVGGWRDLTMIGQIYGHLWPSDVLRLGQQVDDLDWSTLD